MCDHSNLLIHVFLGISLRCLCCWFRGSLCGGFWGDCFGGSKFSVDVEEHYKSDVDERHDEDGLWLDLEATALLTEVFQARGFLCRHSIIINTCRCTHFKGTYITQKCHFLHLHQPIFFNLFSQLQHVQLPFYGVIFNGSAYITVQNSFICYRRIMSSKKKTDLVSILDQLRHEDPKKRLASVLEIREVAVALGPARVRGELIPFLAQFIDDDENIVLELLGQLEGFTALVGGQEQEKALVPLLIAFCRTDEKKCALKASAILQRILLGNKELAGETAKKLMKSDMNTAKECAALMIPALISAHEALQVQLLELYSSLVLGDNPQHKIICAKYMQSLMKSCKSKEEVGRLMDTLYNEGDQLAKIHALSALVDFYEINSNSCLTKFKNLSVLNSWRINIKICDFMPAIFAKCTKPHFKLIFEPVVMKFIASTEPELRAAACRTLAPLAKHLSDQEQKSKLMGCIKKLASDSVDYVKVELSKNIVGLCELVTPDIMNDLLLPIIFSFIKDPNSEISLGVMKSFDLLSTKMSKDTLEEKIIKPLLQQLNTDNWRIKCQILEILKAFIANQSFLSQGVLKVFFALTDDRVDAVRLKINELIVEIINRNNKDWCDLNVIPKVSLMKENASYIKKQNLLDIIEKTCNKVSEKTLKDVYQNALVACLSDKVSNVRIKSAEVLRSSNKLSSPLAQKQLQRLREDKDVEVRETVKKLRA